MTLYVADYLDYYLTLLGWIVNNGIWNVLVASGVFALPFLAIILQEWLRARSEGADEGNKGLLSTLRIESRIWVAIVVILFAGIPFIPVDFATLKFDDTRSRQCQVKVPLPDDTGWSAVFTSLNNQSASVPVWWYFVHALSEALTRSAVAAIPCGADLRQMRMDIDNTRINDPLLAQEVADFTHDCYGPARARLFMSRPTLSEEQEEDINWIGSALFVSTPGYYDRSHSRSPREAWPWNDTRDAGLAQTSNGGYPTCREWWLSDKQGLRSRLLAQVSPDLLSQLARWAGFLSRSELEDSVIQALVAPRQQVMNQGQVYTDYGGQIEESTTAGPSRVAGRVGLSVGSLFFFPAMDLVRQAQPMALSFLKMALAICIPLLLIIGTYELKTVVVISCVEFALFFVDFWFQLARWMDSTLLDALYGHGAPHENFNIQMGINNMHSDLLLNIVMAAMFLVLPGFWIAALSWVGIRAGNMAQMLVAGAKEARDAGGKGLELAARKIR
ncbi:TPA: conjugal transfer protein TraG N-terminal domain-containing protein [Klebsiella quasipneumoniae subsp. quasipneumoniae]|nr:conjugal transfer protein TraG N-terminal domain-containing protein [Klebsiella quasipneumoniae subsp. similipneumoniae]HBR1460307.1 conjugal transfer protein TraG N-terminal domain-containing protein [Klebsiella quasipneumoniae subsp. quasipneumoniae]HBR2034416.1 conjugal transfer protein TraG N-terminal domain-containing protein [Klebsiella quasipneumoniae subsp. quasipneumoniae]